MDRFQLHLISAVRETPFVNPIISANGLISLPVIANYSELVVNTQWAEKGSILLLSKGMVF